jgi:anti-sigma regulatory factor (Ser/Thr protein kinase)
MPDARAAGAARKLVAGMGSELRLVDADALTLLVTELVTNAVRHADLWPDDMITLTVRLEGDRVRVEVTDPGRADASFEPPDGEPPKEGGYGLFLVDGLAAAWGIHRDGSTTVWFELPLRSARAISTT